MQNFIELISNQQLKNENKVKEIKKIQKQLDNSDSYLDTKLIKLFLEDNQELDTESLKESIGHGRTKKILLAIISKRVLTSNELLQNFVLFSLERINQTELNKIYSNIFESFKLLSYKDKISFSFFSAGYNYIYKVFNFAEEFLFDNFNFLEYSKEGNSIIGISGLNFENQQSTLRVTMKLNDTEGSKVLAKTLFDFLSTGVYKNDLIDVFESTLAEFSNINIFLYTNDKNEINACIKDGNYDKFSSNKEDLLGQLNDCLEYLSKRHAYYGIPEEFDEF
jgi:hypothetical protein